MIMFVTFTSFPSAVSIYTAEVMTLRVINHELNTAQYRASSDRSDIASNIASF